MAPPKAEGEAATGQGAALVGTRATLELDREGCDVLNTAKKAGELALTLRSITDMQQPAGRHRLWPRLSRRRRRRSSEGVRVYRYGNETVATAPAG